MIQAHPKFYKDIKSLDLDIDVTNRLSQHLLNTEKGTNDILLTPLAKGISPEDILSRFDKVFDKNRYKINSILQELEISNKAKFGPRSIAKPWFDRENSFSNSFGLGNVDNYVLNIKALSNIINLRPLSLEQSIKLLKNNTNSGLPYFTRKSKVKKRMLNKFEDLLKKRYPCILFTRTQEQGKTRNVWGYPIADTLNEMRFYSPTLGFQKTLNYRSAIVSPDKVSSAITELVKRSIVKENKFVLVSIDFSGYDETVKKALQSISFDYIRSMFQKQYSEDLNYIQDRFNTIGILTPSGILDGPHGIPSGSTFTNEVGSVAQATIALNSKFVSDKDFQVQGDDGVYLVRESDLANFIKEFEECGLIVNKSKSYTSNEFCVYLQNLYHIDYMKDGVIGGIYPVYRALERLIFQERWSPFEDFGIEGKDYYSIRSICILENCKYHPLFRELVKFIYDLDKYSLDFSNQSLSKYVNMMEQTEGARGILQNQYGDNVGGIKSFETYKLIRELSK